LRPLADLAEVAFLADCTRQQRERIASLSTTLDVSAGRRLCRAGGSDRQFLVIVEGKATVTVDDAEVATLGPGCGFGALAVLMPEGRRGAAVTAATPMTLLVLHRGEFDTLAEDVPVIARRVQDETASRLSQATANTTHPATRCHSPSRQTRHTEGRGNGDRVMEVLACLGRTGAWRQRTARRAR
jgi:CRP-like cAMP-binding protein